MNINRTAYGDGLLYRAVAAKIGAPPSEVSQVVSSRGTSLRYGRIGLPAAIWFVALGRPGLMRYAQPIVIILAAGMAAAAAAALFPRAGLLGALLPFLAPGFSLSVAGGYAEVLAVALCLLAVHLVLRERWWGAAAALSIAILTKENAVFVLGALVAWALITRMRRQALVLAAGLVPVGGWFAYVAARYGHIPPLDPYLRVTTDTVGAPVLALGRSLVHAVSTESLVMTLLHIGVGAIAIALWRRSLLGFIATFCSLQLLASAPFAWRYIGDAARISSVLELFTILAVVAWLRPNWTTTEMVTPLRLHRVGREPVFDQSP